MLDNNNFDCEIMFFYGLDLHILAVIHEEFYNNKCFLSTCTRKLLTPGNEIKNWG